MARTPVQHLPGRVPEVLRDTMDPNLVISLLPRYLEDLQFEAAAEFIKAALNHQYLINDTGQEMGPGRDIGWRWFKDTITSVEIIERKSGNRLLGKKARLHLGTPNSRNKSGDDPTIDTGWVEYHGYNPEQYQWEIALSNTIRELAEQACKEKREVLICKHVWAGDGNKLRSIINLKVIRSGDDVPSAASRDGDEAAGGIDLETEIDTAVEDLTEEEDLSDDDIDFLYEKLNELGLPDDELDREEFVREVAIYLDISVSKVRVPKGRKSDTDVEWAVKLLMDNVD